MVQSEYEAVIGLEVHCQLATNTKIFCGCRTKMPNGQSVADVDSNSNTCPVCSGHPGTLPVLNQKVVEFAILAGLATHCRINTTNVFARKNYFYPDLPKGYQISQYETPICQAGWVMIGSSTPGTSGSPGSFRKIEIQRIHMEEDAGKSVHLSGYSLVNLNRAGVPLIEIVSAPDIRSPEEAGEYLRSLYSIVTFLGICDGNMQEGNFRCDANVSVMPRGSQVYGTRAEIKNVNSFRFVEKAIEYEIRRQIDVISGGGRVVQETRTYDSDKNVTHSMRLKDEAQDYRYFPDPDLVPLVIDSSWIEDLRAQLPELPEQKRTRFISEFGLSLYDAGVLTSSKSMALFFEKVMALAASIDFAKPAAHWLTGEVTRLLNEGAIDIDQARLNPSHVVDVVRLVQQGVLSGTSAKQVVSIVWKTGEPVQGVIERENLVQVSDSNLLEPLIDKVIESFPKQVAEYRSGKEKLLGFFVGQAMKETSGKGNPSLLGDLIKKKLSS